MSYCRRRVGIARPSLTRRRNVLIMSGGILLFAAVVTLLDWLGQRKDRQSRNRAV